MIKNFLIVVLLLAATSGKSQYSVSDMFNDAPIVWLGLDFTHAKIDDYNYSNTDLKEKLIPEWNDMIQRGDGEFKLNKYFHRDNVGVDIDYTYKKNKEDFDLKRGSSVERNQIIMDLKEYTSLKTKGIGAVLFVQEMRKEGEKFYGKLAFFDLQTKELLMLKKVHGNGKGFGFRNTWANAIKSSLQYAKRRWSDWEKKILEN